MSDSWTDFQAQVKSQAEAGYRLACFTTIQNFNRTFFYGACQQGTGSWLLMEFEDEDSFYAGFQNNQGGYFLLDFNVSFQNGQLRYYGYWLTGSKQQSMIRALPFDQLVTQWKAAANDSTSPMQMTRVQAYPFSDVATFHAILEAGTGSYAFFHLPVYQSVSENEPITKSFATEVAAITNGTVRGLGYDPVGGFMTGCWGPLSSGAQFFQDVEWDALNKMALSNGAGSILTALAVYPDAPDWDDYLQANLAPYVMGYGYAVARNGQTIITGGAGLARGPNEPQNPSMPFTADSRINLASISKAITGVAMEVFIAQNSATQSLDSLFLGTLKPKLTKPYTPAAATVTLGDLAAMETGLFEYPVDGTGSHEGPADITDSVGGFGPYKTTWDVISDYLSQTPNDPPAYDYNNTNYAILQGYIELALNANASDPGDYTAWVLGNVIGPGEMDQEIVSPVPDKETEATLGYSGKSDLFGGYYWSQFTLVGASGWISSVRELIKLMNALRGTTLLPADTVNSMFNGAIGAWVMQPGTFGNVYFKQGGLTKGDQSIGTGLIRLPEGYDVAIVANSNSPVPVVQVAINAFEARGISTAQLPPGPLIFAAVSAASYMPAVAPGGFVSIFGSGLVETPPVDWTNSITGVTLPTEVGGVSVRVNGVWAAVSYASPAQINFILPGSTVPGTISIEVSTPLGGITFPVTVASVAPALFTYQANGNVYAAAVYAEGSGIVYVGPAGAISGETSRPARAGDIIELYGTGMGPTDPPAPDGMVLTMPYPAMFTNFAVTIGGTQAKVLFAGLAYAGVYQINIQVPQGVPGGDQPLLVSVNRTGSPVGVMITMEQ